MPVILETSLIGDFLDVEGENVVSHGKAQPCTASGPALTAAGRGVGASRHGL